MKILIIEDLKIQATYLVELLTEHNVEAIWADNGKTGISMAKKENPVVILLDVMMPEMDGYETCRYLKKSNITNGIPVIFMTASDSKKSLQKAFEAGASDYVTKPVNDQELLARVKVHIENRKLILELKEATSQYQAQVEEFKQITEQLSNTTNELSHSKNKLKTLIEYTGDAVLTIKDGLFVDCNLATLDFFKVKNKNELLGHHTRDYSPKFQPDGTLSQQKADKYIEIAIQKGSTSYEWEHIDSFGEPLTVEITLSSNVVENETLIFAVMRNISQRKKVERSLLSSEKRFREIFINFPAAYQSLNSRGNFIYINDGWLAMTGYKRNEVIGKSFGKFWSDDTKHLFEEVLVNCKKSLDIDEMELKLKCKNGEIIDVILNGRVQLNSDGKFVRIHCVIMNITKRKLLKNDCLEIKNKLKTITKEFEDLNNELQKSTDALLDSEEKFKALVKNSNDFIWEIDENAKYIYASKQIEQMLGYKPDEIINKKQFDFVIDNEREKAINYFNEVALNKQAFINVINTYKHKNGKSVMLKTNATPIIDELNILTGYRGVISIHL